MAQLIDFSRKEKPGERISNPSVGGSSPPGRAFPYQNGQIDRNRPRLCPQDCSSFVASQIQFNRTKRALGSRPERSRPFFRLTRNQQ
jgi:hypothetical protein